MHIPKDIFVDKKFITQGNRKHNGGSEKENESKKDIKSYLWMKLKRNSGINIDYCLEEARWNSG